jgi:HSP20 family protein
MAFTDLLPWRRDRRLPVRHAEESPLFSFQNEFNRLFDELWHNVDRGASAPWSGGGSAFSPSVNVDENDKAYTVTAELPGLDDEDVSIELEGHMLILKGEKKEEREEKEGSFLCRERCYGTFERRIALSDDVDRDKVDAHYRKGVLTITLPKLEAGASQRKKISVKTS